MTAPPYSFFVCNSTMEITLKGRGKMEERNETLASEVIAAVKKDLVFFKILAALLIFALLAQGLYGKH